MASQAASDILRVCTVWNWEAHWRRCETKLLPIWLTSNWRAKRAIDALPDIHVIVELLQVGVDVLCIYGSKDVPIETSREKKYQQLGKREIWKSGAWAHANMIVMIVNLQAYKSHRHTTKTQSYWSIITTMAHMALVWPHLPSLAGTCGQSSVRQSSSHLQVIDSVRLWNGIATKLHNVLSPLLNLLLFLRSVALGWSV